VTHVNKVIRSVSLEGDAICVDVFQRPDGSSGFDEYRRDPEDGRGWYSMAITGSGVLRRWMGLLRLRGWLCSG